MSVINALDGLLDIDCHDHGYDPFRKKPKISARVCNGNITEQWSYCFIGCVLGLVSCLGVLDKNREFLALKNLYRLFEELTRVGIVLKVNWMWNVCEHQELEIIVSLQGRFSVGGP